LTTPISEAAITGVGIGLAVTGRRAFVEIMFGDFITYAFDQIVNNASKMFHMYNRRIDCPVVIRTPMGGRRGYGPTHSQSLERFLIGIDNCCTISLNSLVSVETQLFGLKSLKCPVLLLENKSDYTAKTYALPEGFVAESDQFCLPTLRIGPEDSSATISLLAYGGMARFIANSLVDIFERTDCIPELIVPTGLHPLNLQPIAQSVRRTGRLVIIEEGAGFGNFGAEVVTQLTELGDVPLILARVSGKSAPIPSAPLLEAAALPSIDDVCMAILSVAARAHD
jgi:2-oxoisovalerate dehydrogenase E1 component